MKKLFVSCPTTGYKLDEVLNICKRMHKIAEGIFGEELEMIDVFRVTELTKFDMYDMARHIEAMAQADYFIGFAGIFDGNCLVERTAAYEFKIPIYEITHCEMEKPFLEKYYATLNKTACKAEK